MELLAGLSVTTKAVERTAEGIGADIEMHQQRELILHARTKDASRIRFWNPLVPGLPFSVGTGLEIIASQERRHPLQAERVRDFRDVPLLIHNFPSDAGRSILRSHR